MLFNSFAFLGFFAVVAALYWALPHRWRWVLLLVASAWFYSSYDARYLALLGFATGVAWGYGRIARPGGSRLLLTAAVLAELSVLVAFKYVDFLARSAEGLLGAFGQAITLPRMEFLLPAGLSFYTFSCIAYVVDVHRGKLEAERHPGRLAVYVAFFPKLLAGPIERAGPFLAQLTRPQTFQAANLALGLQLMLWGLFKKVVIADRLAVFVDAGFNNPQFQSPMAVVIAVYFYAFQIYCDFSGYSDIAIGAALVLGFRLMENFRRPYLARSVPEFWNGRWHLSLSRWFRDYLYIPLGGNRVGWVRRQLNIMIVFLVSGLWHGANWTFVVWGGLNGLYQVLHAALAAPRAWFGRRLPLPAAAKAVLAAVLTFHLVGLAWIFFRAKSLEAAQAVLGKLWTALPKLPTLAASFKWTGEHYLSLALIALLIAVELLDERRPVSQRLAAAPIAVRWGAWYLVAGALLVIGLWGTSGFVYMSF